MTPQLKTRLSCYLKLILEVFFPSHCISCQNIIRRNSLFCHDCFIKLQFITEPKCKICSYPFEIEIPDMSSLCGKCLIKKPSFDKLVTIFSYNHIIRKAITSLKYHDQTFLSKKLAILLKEKAKNEIDNCDIIAAIPLHLNRLRKRKFNQASIIAKNLSKNKFIPDLIWRVKDTTPQVSLRKKQRKSNLKRAFLVNKKYRTFLKNKKILLIDDVITTGATIENCARELKRRDVKEVVVLTIAKTIFD